MNAPGAMTDDGAARSSAPTATFHARVAGVGLVTTVVVLLAACLTFMLQQWAVSREESRISEAALNAVVAEIAAPAETGTRVEAMARRDIHL